MVLKHHVHIRHLEKCLCHVIMSLIIIAILLFFAKLHVDILNAIYIRMYHWPRTYVIIQVTFSELL